MDMDNIAQRERVGKGGGEGNGPLLLSIISYIPIHVYWKSTTFSELLKFKNNFITLIIKLIIWIRNEKKELLKITNL